MSLATTFGKGTPFDRQTRQMTDLGAIFPRLHHCFAPTAEGG